MRQSPEPVTRRTAQLLREIAPIAEELGRELADDLDALAGWAALVRDRSDRGEHPGAEADALLEEAIRVARTHADLVMWLSGRRGGGFSPAARLLAVAAGTVAAGPARPVRVVLGPGARHQIAGPVSFFDRVATSLIRDALVESRAGVRISLRGDRRGGRNGITLRVQEDGTPPDRRAPSRENRSQLTGWILKQLDGVVVPSEPELADRACGIWFPVMDAPPPNGWTVGMTPLHGIRIALLGDDSTARAETARLLIELGADVSAVHPGSVAFGQLLAGALPHHVLLMDGALPHATTAAIAAWLDNRPPPAPVPPAVLVLGDVTDPAAWGDHHPVTIAAPADVELLATAILSAIPS